MLEKFDNLCDELEQENISPDALILGEAFYTNLILEAVNAQLLEPPRSPNMVNWGGILLIRGHDSIIDTDGWMAFEQV